jgi:hypothetical protein
MVILGDFSQQADAYRRSRPTYPKALVNLLIEDAKVAAGDAVADFGAGNGIFTSLLVERGFRVTAIEPIVPGSTYWNVAFGREKGEVRNDTEGLDTVKNLARNMAWLMKRLAIPDEAVGSTKCAAALGS